jgi:hypothetical protein
VRTGALTGYPRLSTCGQLPGRQQRALAAAGCVGVVAGKLPGKTSDRPGLAALPGLPAARRHPGGGQPGRLSGSLAGLIQIAGTPRRRGVGVTSLAPGWTPRLAN